MDKISSIKQYVETVKQNRDFFRKYYFHSIIDLNLIKLDYILKYGILSKNLIKQKGLINLYTHDSSDFDSKNGETFVSLSEYKDNCEFSMMFESFSLHALTSVSLLVNKNVEVTKCGERETYFDDEVFCLNYVSKSDLDGIILSEHLANLSIREVSCLPNDLSCYTKDYINNWLFCIESYFGRKISEENKKRIKNSFIQLWNILSDYERPENWLQTAIQTQRKLYGKDLKDELANVLHINWSEKLKISNPKYIEVVMQINKDLLPVYEIKEKSLKKIN